MIVVEVAGITDTGQVRQRNEDDLLIDSRLHLYAVADGIGGRKGGDIASGLAIDAFRASLHRSLSSAGKDDEIPCDETLSPEANLLNAAVHMANRIVHEKSSQSKSNKGMGTTLSAVYFTSSTFIAINVGDSPIYRIHKGEIEQVSTPHLYYDPTPGGRKKPYLTRGIGIKDFVKPDTCEMQCFDNDLFIICSDGLSSKVTAMEIHDIVSKEKVERACNALVNLANSRGGEDNITMVIIKVISVNIKQSKVVRFFSSMVDAIKTSPDKASSKKRMR